MLLNEEYNFSNRRPVKLVSNKLIGTTTSRARFQFTPASISRLIPRRTVAGIIIGHFTRVKPSLLAK